MCANIVVKNINFAKRFHIFVSNIIILSGSIIIGSICLDPWLHLAPFWLHLFGAMAPLGSILDPLGSIKKPSFLIRNAYFYSETPFFAPNGAKWIQVEPWIQKLEPNGAMDPKTGAKWSHKWSQVEPWIQDEANWS